MKEKDILKTVFNFFIIDLVIFAIFSFLIAFIIAILLNITLGVSREFISPIGFVLLLVLMWWNYKYRYEETFKEEDAIKVLELRYAKGKITKEEYKQMKKDLEG